MFFFFLKSPPLLIISGELSVGAKLNESWWDYPTYVCFVDKNFNKHLRIFITIYKFRGSNICEKFAGKFLHAHVQLCFLLALQNKAAYISDLQVHEIQNERYDIGDDSLYIINIFGPRCPIQYSLWILNYQNIYCNVFSSE